MLLLPEVDGGGGGERSLPRRLDAPTVAVTAGGAADGTLADPDMPTIGSYCPGCSRACSCAMKSKARCFRSVLSSLYMRRSGPSLSSLEAMGSEEKCTGGAICTFLTTCRFSRSDAASATNMCSAGLGWFCSVSEKSNVIQVKSSQLSVASMAFGELPRLRAHQTADASGRSPARGRHARPHPRPTSDQVPHMRHGTWHTSGSEGRERSHANHMGESRGTSTNVHRPRVASRRPALPASLSVLRLRALLSIKNQLTNMFSPCTRRVAGRRASRPASPGSSALRRLLILEETEKLGVQSAAVNGCRLTIQNRPR